jgi:putative mRNA 3-end processing factor
MVRYLQEQGLQAGAFDTEYGDDVVEADAAPPASRARAAMKQFSQLFAELDATTSTNAKVEALQRYFAGRRAAPTPPGRCTSWPAASRAR